jgi:D-3-phosphoglycerate dehydrogenase / 2-oxoglutarate reductase
MVAPPKQERQGGDLMKATFIDCPPFLKTIYDESLTHLAPDLVINLGSPSRDEVIELLRGSPFAMNDHTLLDEALLAACPDLRCIVFLGTGSASYIDLAAAERLGIKVRNYGGYGDQSVAEQALALMFAAARKLAKMDRGIREGRWETLDGIELSGKTLGVIGTGGIGRAMIRLGAGIGMKVMAWNRSGVPGGLPCEEVALDELLRTADVVSLHLVLNDQTRGFLGRERLGLMKPSAIFINTARGAIVDEAALVEVLQAGRIAHAGLDVFVEEPLPAGHPLSRLDNVTLAAHSGFATDASSYNLLRIALEILAEERAAAGG